MNEIFRFALANILSAAGFFAVVLLVQPIRHRVAITDSKWRLIMLIGSLAILGGLFLGQIKLDIYVWHFFEVDQYFMANRIILALSGVVALILVCRRISVR